MTRWIVFGFVAWAGFSSLGCLGGLRQGSASRLARGEFSKDTACEQAKSEVVREFSDKEERANELKANPRALAETEVHKKRLDYLAEVSASGCGRTQMYICAQQDADWWCVPK